MRNWFRSLRGLPLTVAHFLGHRGAIPGPLAQIANHTAVRAQVAA
jgi:hypothetical protein